MRRILLLIFDFLLIPAALLAEGGFDLKLTHSGTTDVNAPGTPTACWNFDSAVGGTYTDDCASTYTMTVNGTPTLLTGDGTWPNGLSGTGGKGWLMDGSGDSLTRGDDGSFDMDLAHNPTGHFTIQCAVIPYATPAADKAIIGKVGVAHNDDGWILYQNAGAVHFLITDTGRVDLGQMTVASVPAALVPYRPAFITATYEYIGSGNSKMRLYVDDLATGTSNTARGDVWDSSEALSISPGANGLNGLFQYCILWKDEILTEAEHDQAFASFQGRLSTTGIPVAVTSASPPSIMQKDCATADGCFIDQPANSIYIGIWGIFGSPALTSKWWRGSCETCDGANHCTGWTMWENVSGGAGTLVIDCDSTTSVHGGTSIKFTSDGGGAPKYAQARGACQVGWIGQDVLVSAWGITTSGTADCRIGIQEYDAANCTTWLATTMWGPGDPGANWDKLSTSLAAGAWNALTSSWYPFIRCDDNGGAYTANFDAGMALQAASTFDTDLLVVSDSDADAVSTDTIYTIQQPTQITAGGSWTIEATVSSPIDGAVGSEKWIYVSPGTDGNKNRIVFYHSADELGCIVYDSGAVGKESRVAMDSDPSEEWDVKCMKSHEGVLTVCAKVHGEAAWTCDATPDTGALQDDISSTAYLAYDGSTVTQTNIHDIQFFNRVRP